MKSTKPIKLTINTSNQWYNSKLDEDAFFWWLGKIPCVIECKGESERLHIFVNQDKTDKQNLSELMALFYRWQINIEQLKVLLNKNNENWFTNREQNIFYNEIFKNKLIVEPKQVNCFQCSKTFLIKYVTPKKSYSKKNNWEYWVNPEANNPNFWKDKEARKKDRYICNEDLLKFYYDKEIFWKTISDLKKRTRLRVYINERRYFT